MSARSLRRRVDALLDGREPEEVVQALWALARTETAPPGPAGVRALQFWDEALRQGCMTNDIRFLRSYVRAGGSFTEILSNPEFIALVPPEGNS